MKIELTCRECGKPMRADAADSGKQIRCPTCGFVSLIPVEKGRGGIKGDSAFEDHQPPPVSDSSIDLNEELLFGLDKAILISFALGVASIVLNFTCCGAYVAFPISLVGLAYVFRSRSGLKQSGYVLNGIGAVISICFLLFKYFF